MRIIIYSFLFLTAFTGVVAGQSVAVCPKVEIIGPSKLTNAGDKMTFIAVVKGIDSGESDLIWEIQGGKIINGQGTDAIQVETDEESDIQTVQARVTLRNISIGCNITAIETATVIPALPTCSLDDFGELEENLMRSRFDQFFIELKNNPTNKGLLIFYLEQNASLTNDRVKIFLDQIRLREMDKEIFIVAITQSDRNNTTLFRIPPEAKLPKCDSCIFYSSLGLP